LFRKTENINEISRKRELKTHDIVKRLSVISPNRVHLKNYPIDNPVSIFNPALIVREETAYIYARIILGYFMYVSAIVRLEVPLDDIYSSIASISHYPCSFIVNPSTKYDIWGTEDPRITEIDNKLYMTYVGRTINYFNPAVRRERTLPVIAISENNSHRWSKKLVLVLPKDLRDFVVSDKDAFIIKTRNGEILVFHRPHLTDEKFYLLISKISVESLKPNESIKEVEVKNATIVLEALPEEHKLGWATPPIEIEPDTYLTLVHGVDKYIEGYRVFAALVKYDKDVGPRVIAVTPYYIMEPKTPYELFGDRPYTIFPCGLYRVDKDKALISYGAGDFVVGIAELDINEAMAILDKNRVE